MTSQTETIPTPRSRSKTPGLTKSGVPRKPHVMTEARKVAFAKCVAARQHQLQKRKEEKPIKTESDSIEVTSTEGGESS